MIKCLIWGAQLVVDVLVDSFIILLVVISALYGYKKGFIAIAMKPIRSAFRIGSAVMFCIPFSNLLYLSLIMPLAMENEPDIVKIGIGRAISVILSFVLILAFAKVVISVLANTISFLFGLGIIGSINRLVGLISMTCIGAIIAFGLCHLLRLLSPSFGIYADGPIYGFFISLA